MAVKGINLTINDTSEIEISVTDQGMGLNLADRANLFKPYFKSSCAKNRAANSQSNGLGLSISKKIAQVLGGDLSLCPDYKNGCRFVLRLKLQQCGEETRQQEYKIGKSMKNRQRKLKRNIAENFEKMSPIYELPDEYLASKDF